MVLAAMVLVVETLNLVLYATLADGLAISCTVPMTEPVKTVVLETSSASDWV